MYSTYSYADSGPSGGLLLLLFVGLICALIAYLFAIHVLVGVLRDKEGERYLPSGMAWLIGIFATPLLLALVVIAIPDGRDAPQRAPGLAPAGVQPLPDSDLPQI